MPLQARLDFTNASDPSPYSPKHVPSGEYRGIVKGVESREARDGTEMWVYAIGSPDIPGAVYPQYIKLDEKGLWKLRQLAEACGMIIPKKVVNVNANKFVGKELGIILEEDEYQGKLKSTITKMIPLSEVVTPTDEVMDDEQPKKKKKKKVEDDDYEVDLDEI